MKISYRIACGAAFVLATLPMLAQAFPVITGQEANFRQGQVDWTSGFADPASDVFFGARTVDEDTLFAPSDALYDATNQWLFVADTLNRRVLVFDAAGGTTFSDVPLFVLGQPNFTTGGADPSDPFGGSNTPNAGEACAAGVNACGFRRPFSLAFDDDNSLLFVADPDNRRILIWDLSAPENGMAASWVLGQSSFASDDMNQDCGGGTTAAVNGCGMNFPSSVAFDSDSQRLFVADSANHRVLVFDTTSLSNGMPATAVIGQEDLLSNNANIACGGGAAGPTSACGLNWPASVAWDAGADQLFIGDANNNRVLAFDLSGGVTPGAAADAVLGQPDFNSASQNTDCGGGGSGESNTNACGVGGWGTSLETSNDHLYVTDIANHRVLAYAVATIANGVAATAVIGQDDFLSGYDGASVAYGGATDRSSMVSPQGLAVDDVTDRLFVADVGNHRVMVYGANVGGTAVETIGDVSSSQTTENPDGSVSIEIENSQGDDLSVTFPPGTEGQDGEGVQVVSGYVGGDPDQPGLLIVADLPDGETKEVSLPLFGNTSVCVIDQETTVLAAYESCGFWYRIDTPANGTCETKWVVGELGDNPLNASDPWGLHPITACTAPDGSSVTVSDLLHSFVAITKGVARPDFTPDTFDPEAFAGEQDEDLDQEQQPAPSAGCSSTGQSTGLASLMAFALLGLFLFSSRKRATRARISS